MDFRSSARRWNNPESSTVNLPMSAAFGPAVLTIACFQLGVVASCTSHVREQLPRVLALTGAADEQTRWRRATVLVCFAAGVTSFFAPIGFVAALSGSVMRHALYQTVSVGVLVVATALLAASMFGAKMLSLPAALREKLSTIGHAGHQGAFALGVAFPLVAAATILPLAGGLAMAMLASASAWTGAAAFAALALGMAAPVILGGVFRIRGPRSRGWAAMATWGLGVALGYFAFSHVHDRSYSLQELVKIPHYDFGIVTGAVLAVGVGLAALHVVFDARAARGSRLARVSKALRVMSVLPAVIGGSLFVSWAPHPHGNAPPMVWHGDETYARALAAQQGKPVIVTFNADWCCKEMGHETFPNPRVREEATRFVSIAVDATDDEAPGLKHLQDKYKVVGLPTLIVFDSRGREAGRVNSFVGPDVIAAMLHDVH